MDNYKVYTYKSKIKNRRIYIRYWKNKLESISIFDINKLQFVSLEMEYIDNKVVAIEYVIA